MGEFNRLALSHNFAEVSRETKFFSFPTPKPPAAPEYIPFSCEAWNLEYWDSDVWEEKNASGQSDRLVLCRTH